MFSILAEKKNMCIHQQSTGIIGKYQHAGIWPKSNIVRPWFPHSKRLNNQQQKVERVSVQHTVNRHKRSQKLIRLLELWPLSQISVSHGSSLQSAWFSHVSVSLSLLLFLFPSSPSLVHVSTVLIVYFLTSLSPCGYQTYGRVTWWSWCWRFLYRRSLTASATCCCVRSGFYWACSTATLLCERSVHLMSTGETFCTGIIFSGFSFMAGHDWNKGFFLLPPSSVLGWSSWCQAVQGALLCPAAALHLVCATSCANRRMTF